MSKKNVTVVTLGQSPVTSDREVNTVAELAESLGLSDSLQVKINGQTASYDDEVTDYAFISFGEKIKGGSPILDVEEQMSFESVLDAAIQYQFNSTGMLQVGMY